MSFTGFLKSVQATPVPDPMLGILLQDITDISELKVTLRGFWLTNQRKGSVRPIHINEFLNDKVLTEGLRHYDSSPEDAIRNGLLMATNRQTFIRYAPSQDDATDTYYLINTEAHRQAIPSMDDDKVTLSHQPLTQYANYHANTDSSDQNIFLLYENNIGTISPILADQLREAENTYPWPWITEAFKIAVDQNARSWAYISAILRRWTDEGKNSGKSGRHSEKDNQTSHLDEYRQIRGHLPWERSDR
jgi:DnaD/phage-associated family protein